MQHAAISRPKPLIVAHLLLLMAAQPRHGYELAASLRTLEFEGVTPSTVYRDLSRLEAEGLVRSFWEASQARGPARHMYELTDAGRENLAACADDVRCLIAHLTNVLGQIESFGVSASAGDGSPARGRRRFWKAP
jgi:PadR family transcriptional regulator PadR